MRHIVGILMMSMACSCSLVDSFDEEPMFLEIDKVDLQTEILQGAPTHDIEAISVYADGFNIGVFPLPASVPVLDDDATTMIDILPVIKNNGQGNNRVEYPFYEGLNFPLQFEPLKVTNLDLVFNYRDDVNFIWIEDFENPHSLIVDVDGNSDVSFSRDSDALSGEFAGKVTTTAENPRFEKASSQIFPAADVRESVVYIELDYKSEIAFRIGIIGYRSMQGTRLYKIELVPNQEWTKLYLDLTQEINIGDFDEYQIVLSSGLINSDLGSLWIDNIKLTHF